MKIILCGFNWSGCEALEKLKKHKIFVYTHISKYYEPSLINFCELSKIPYSTKKISLENLPFKPDLIISISYKYKIPENVLKLSKFKPFNLHPSLLPKYRGCSSVTWAIVNNEKYTGYSYHYMNKNLDRGNIIYQKKIKIKKFDLQSTLYSRVMFDSLQHLNKVINLVKKGYRGVNQKGKSSYYKRGAPFKGKINKKWSVEKKKNFIRAMINPPRPLAKFRNKTIKQISNLL